MKRTILGQIVSLFILLAGGCKSFPEPKEDIRGHFPEDGIVAPTETNTASG